MTAWILLVAGAWGGPLPADARQLLVTTAPGPDASSGTLTRWRRDGPQEPWIVVGGPIPVRLGEAGLAWGRGLHPPQPGLQKVEGDDRAPAGVFRLGSAYGYAPAPPPGATWPYEVVGPRDLWVEDPLSPLYNRHLDIPGDRPLLEWEAAAVMIQDVPAHALKVAVAHNAPPDAVAGGGSAIFLHAWRADGVHATAGCTSMARERLDEVVTWLDPASHPVYVVLAEADLERLREAWDLPGR